MLVALALACLPLLWWALYARAGSGRVALLLALVGWTTYLVAVTEVLSLARALRPLPLAAAWGVLLVALALLARRTPFPSEALLGALRRWRGEPIAILVTLILAALLVIALVAPPNNWDAMTYHMARVAHWTQNGTVATYATHNARQIHMGPGAEFVVLHFQVLTGGDRLANAVQWFALVGCVVGVSVVARAMGAGPRGQLYAAALCGSLPMAVLQATSTQNDLTAALWLVCCAALGLELRRTPHHRLLVAGVGLSMGLAVLTKATTLLVLPAFAMLLLMTTPAPIRRRVTSAAVALLLALLVNAGFFTRNVAASGSVLGPQVERYDGERIVYTNGTVTPRSLVSNVLRNIAVQLALPSWSWNKRIDELVRTTHLLIGADPDDPRTTVGRQRFHLSDQGDREDQAQGFIVVVLGTIALLALLRATDPPRRLQLAYALCVLASFLLFCAVLKWQPWHTRLHLPMLVLLTPLVGAFIERGVPRSLQGPLVVLILLACLPSVLRNPSRPAIGKYSIFRVPRDSQYFTNRADLIDKYESFAADFARGPCDRVGLIVPHDGWEYPLWIVLKRAHPALRIKHIDVENYTARYAEPFEPCAIVRVGKDGRVTR